MSRAGTAAPAASDDAFLGGALHILQPAAGYRAGLDAVLLAAAAPAATGKAERVLDIGAGVGVVGLAVARRIDDARVVMVERDATLAGLARDNALRNGLADRVRVIEADVVQPLSRLGDLAGMTDGFDHVLANPPFHVEGRGTVAGDARKAAGHAMPEGDLARWVRLMAAMARPGGTATLIHRADALGDILAACAGRFGGTIVLPIHPRHDEPASRVLVQGIKGSRSPLQVMPGFVLHDGTGGFRLEAEAILRHGGGLDLRNRAPRP